MRMPDIPFHVSSDDADQAIPGHPKLCTIALGAHEVIRPPVTVAYDVANKEVTIAWDETDEAGVLRHHTGTVEPKEDAMHLVLITDGDKRALVRSFPDKGYDLKVTNHRAPPKRLKKDSPEKRAEYELAAKRNAELRAEGKLAPVKRRRPRVTLRRGGHLSVIVTTSMRASAQVAANVEISAQGDIPSA